MLSSRGRDKRVTGMYIWWIRVAAAPGPHLGLASTLGRLRYPDGCMWFSASDGPSIPPCHPYQGMQYDSGGELIAAWIPPLSRLPVDLRHQPWLLESGGVTEYPSPMVDVATQTGQIRSKQKP